MTTSENLLTRVANGDLPALHACIERHTGLVRSIARRFMRGDTDVDDVVQEVFLDVWRSARRFDGRGEDGPFIAMITRRRLIDRLRRSQRRPRTESLDTAPVGSASVTASSVEAGGETALLRRHLRTLRPAQRRVLLMSAMGGWSHGEISRELGLPLGTVKAHAKRGMTQLRRALAEPTLA